MTISYQSLSETNQKMKLSDSGDASHDKLKMYMIMYKYAKQKIHHQFDQQKYQQKYLKHVQTV